MLRHWWAPYMKKKESNCHLEIKILKLNLYNKIPNKIREVEKN
jgi:hypothetical protein